MRPVWSGAVSFGLVTIPIKVLPATEDHSIRFHQYHQADQGRIRNRKVCEIDGRQLGQHEIGKGYEMPGGDVVTITDHDLDDMPLPTARAIEIVAFVPADSIDPVRIADSYYLAADGQVSAKPYKLLRLALGRSSKVAVAKFAWRDRERLGLLRVVDDVIVLHSMKWPDEIRSPESLTPKPVDLDDDEVDAAIELMETMHVDTLGGFRDRYTDAVQDLIEAKSTGKEPPHGDVEEPAAGQVVDLMAALQDSVRKAQESRGETGEDASVHEMKPRKKTAAKASKKPAAKKATPKKRAAKKGA